jgi:putative DNA primase/helicase
VNSDLADLRGCRFVSSSEVEQGQRLSLSRVKQLTGMGKVKARRLHENWITFPATHKIFIDANHRPVVTDPHDAVWNRIKCIPFSVEIPPDRIDTSLPARLRAELPGILRFIVEGSVLYLKEGLGDPPAIISATTETYRQESDQIAEFIDDKCIQNSNDPNCWIPVAELYPGYVAWGLANGYKDLLSKRDFDEQIKLKNCAQERRYIPTIRGKIQTRVWSGIRFRAHDDDSGQVETGGSRADC